MKNVEALSDEELVAYVRTTDQEAYVHLVTRYQDKLLRYATYLISDHDLAEDVVQTTFIKAFQNLFSFNLNKKFSSWIYRICHNEAMNQVKKHQKEQQFDYKQWEKIADETDIETQISRQEITQMVNQSINQLPPKYRSVISLYYLDNQSYEEISHILKIPVGTVGTNLHRGKLMLKNIYQENGDPNGQSQ